VVLCSNTCWLCRENQAQVKHKGKPLPCFLYGLTIVSIVRLGSVLLSGSDRAYHEVSLLTPYLTRMWEMIKQWVSYCQ
jgi:hypothetical protein